MIDLLEKLQADSIPHVRTSLLEHLQGTYRLLHQWGNHTDLCLAGLCHAVYGTDGFAPILLKLDSRSVLRSLCGERVEQLVYVYSSADRGFLYPQLRRGRLATYCSRIQASLGLSRRWSGWRRHRIPLFKDRFTGDIRQLPTPLWSDFLELTVANELEILQRDPPESAEVKTQWLRLFLPCKPWLSRHAYAHVMQILS